MNVMLLILHKRVHILLCMQGDWLQAWLFFLVLLSRFASTSTFVRWIVRLTPFAGSLAHPRLCLFALSLDLRHGIVSVHWREFQLSLVPYP